MAINCGGSRRRLIVVQGIRSSSAGVVLVRIGGEFAVTAADFVALALATRKGPASAMLPPATDGDYGAAGGNNTVEKPVEDRRNTAEKLLETRNEPQMWWKME